MTGSNLADHPFQPGVKVAVVDRSRGLRMYRAGGCYIYRASVVTVHETGRFVLAGGGDVQWRPRKSYSGWTGFRRDSHERVELITPELLAEEARCKRAATIDEALYRLVRFGADLTEEDANAIIALADRLVPKDNAQ